MSVSKRLAVVAFACAAFTVPSLLLAAEPAIAPSDLDPRVYDPRPEAHLSVAELEKRAAAGDMKAQSELGGRYGGGVGVKQDLPKAIELLKAAAAKNDQDGLYFLGTAYASGLGVPQNDAQAVMYYEQAAEQGNAGAELALANTIIAGKGGVAPNLGAGVRYLWASAVQGYPPAMIQMGQYFHDGKGVERNFDAAAYWYRRALQLTADVRTIFNLRRLIELRVVEWEPGDPGEEPGVPPPNLVQQAKATAERNAERHK